MSTAPHLAPRDVAPGSRGRGRPRSAAADQAILDATLAVLAEDVEVGPFAVIGADVTLGPGCVINAHAVVSGPTTLGANNHVFQFASIVSDGALWTINARRSSARTGP